jgi:signal transduction histidine kinase
MYDDFLKKVPLFAELPDEDLEQICGLVQNVALEPGEQLFAEGDAGDHAYIVKEGQLEIIKNSSGREVLLNVLESGEIIGEMSLLVDHPRNASVRARTPSRLLAITPDQLEHLFNASPTAARIMLRTVADRLRATDNMLRQSEKMAQLGTLSAGMAHELNNPAAAAQRGAAQLKAAIGEMQRAQLAFVDLGLIETQLDRLRTLYEVAEASASNPADLDTLARSDRETEIERWLAGRSIDEAWQLAPSLLNMGFDPARLDELSGEFPKRQLPAVLAWLHAIYTAYSLMEEIAQGAGRISEIVKALKLYVYLDQAPMQTVNLHAGLDNTLVLLRSRLKGGINVRREYAGDVPLIEAYGSELNQVWTNIIDNAAAAMEGHGALILRTRQEDGGVVVEIEDNGPGIPEEHLGKIFDPFFTTKPPGQGTGLGLNITYNIVVNRHRGEINVRSQPGKTVFEIWLPVRLEETRPTGRFTVAQRAEG